MQETALPLKMASGVWGGMGRHVPVCTARGGGRTGKGETPEQLPKRPFIISSSNFSSLEVSGALMWEVSNIALII